MYHEELLKDLIRIKSYSGEENELRNFILKWFNQRSIECFIQDENLIVHFEGKDRTRAFIFNSHMDTVSQGDIEWKHGPWNPTKVDDKIIGLGASDMKGGMTSSMLLAEQVAKRGKPETDMWFTYVVREELDGSGTEKFSKWFSDNGYPQKYADMAGIFTEPSNLKEVEHGHRGNMFLKAVSEGDSGHASRPDKIKKHAVREMIKFADALQAVFIKWQKEYSGTKFEPPTVGEMTSIQAGLAGKIEGNKVRIEVESPNKFSSICVATFDVRTTPDFHKVAFKRISEVGKKYGVKIDYAFPPAPAGYTDPNEKIIKIARKIVTGSKLTVSKGSADLGFLTDLGVKAIIFGPGLIEQCHKVDEYTFSHQIPQAIEIYNQIVNAWVA